jgi:hypothetical protein
METEIQKKKKKKENVNFGKDFGKCQICKFIQHISIKTYYTQHGQQENIYTLCTHTHNGQEEDIFYLQSTVYI